MKMLNFNDDFWHGDSSCLTFLRQTALIICGATSEITQKTQLHKKAALKRCCISKYCLFGGEIRKELKAQENLCDVCTLFYNVVPASFGKHQIILSHENKNIHQIPINKRTPFILKKYTWSAVRSMLTSTCYQPEPVWFRWISAGLCGFNPRADSGVLARPGGDRPEDNEENSHQNTGSCWCHPFLTAATQRGD